MEKYYYSLSGGINQATTKTNLGLDTKNIHWSDSKNIEIFQNKGIIRQKGNVAICQLEDNEKIIALHQMKYAERYRLLIVTDSGKLYVYNPENSAVTKLEKTINSQTPNFTDFLNGVVVTSSQDAMFFIKNNSTYDIIDCNLKDTSGNQIYSSTTTVYKGRIWAVTGSSLYFSALGTYNDFSSPNDAGYIRDFYTDTDTIIALKPYKEYLAIYKKNSVYLLTGDNPSNFAVVPFADKGACSSNGIVTVNNKQYFLSQGVFTLEVGQLNQILLGNEITLKIKPEFVNFDKKRMNESLACFFVYYNFFIIHNNNSPFMTLAIFYTIITLKL